MTTIIFLQNTLPLQGIPDKTEDLVNYHVHATQSRFPWELQARLLAFTPIRLERFMTPPWPYAEYKAIITRLNESNPVWSLRDDRILLFMDDFARLVGDARLLWVELHKPHTEYEKEVQKLNKAAFEKFAGPKLHLTEDDPAALRFALAEREEPSGSLQKGG